MCFKFTNFIEDIALIKDTALTFLKVLSNYRIILELLKFAHAILLSIFLTIL